MRARNMLVGFVVSAALLTGASARAATLHVPSEYATIQAAIDAAAPGDIVLVADGTYTGPGNKDLDFGGKAITVRSENGPDHCIIDCEHDGRGFYFHSGEEADSVVDGFTITNGSVTEYYSYGGGIYCSSSSPTIANCTINGNTATGQYDGHGGGIYCEYSNATITNCTIHGNSTTGEYEKRGGGIYCEYGSPTITHCTIRGNSVTGSYGGHGGGVYCYHGSPTISSCTIVDNHAPVLGGGILCGWSDATIIDCTVRENRARDGGGIYCNYGSPMLTNCTISGNVATREFGHGGGVYCNNSNPIMANCTIRDNLAHGDGGGVYCNHGSPTISNCTIRGNSAYHGGGIANYNDSSPAITNTILWNDVPEELFVLSGLPILRYCDIQGGWSGTGNIDADPLFAFPDDSRLLATSPCIDAGTNDVPGGLPDSDPDGNSRSLDGDGDGVATADIGAYEFNPASPSIALSPGTFEFAATQGWGNPADQALSLRNCGGGMLNWEINGQPAWLTVSPVSGQSGGDVNDVTLSVDISALAPDTYTAELQVIDALAVNSPRGVSVTLVVGRTLHVPSEYSTIQAAIDAAANADTVLVADGTYTGPGNKNLDFGGKAITVRSENGPDHCIIDCENDGRGFYFHSGEGADSVADGFTIRNGSVDRGGGVYCYFSGPTIANCTISGCSVNAGGGVSCYAGSPTIVNCTIVGNSARTYGGGGIYSYGGSLAITGCTIGGNAATSTSYPGRGGGIHVEYGDSTITSCTIGGNTAFSGGGAYFLFGHQSITNCTIVGNSARGYRGGGGILVGSGSPTITNCTISGNSASDGGGILCRGDSNPTITNTILWNDTPEEIYVDSSSPIVSYCDVQGGWTGPGNIDAEPLLACSDDGHILPGSPCIDAGTNDPPGGLPDSDLDGNPRLLDGDGDAVATGDIGAYEFNPAAPSIAMNPVTVEFLAPGGGGSPEDQTLLLRNCGGGMLSWEISGQPAWLTVSPSSGQSGGEVNHVALSVNISTLSPGTYTALLRVSDPLAVNSPREIPVALSVGRTLHVPDEYPTIQAAIDAAATADTVLVADGTYTGPGNKNLDFGGKAITVRGENGPDRCIIDCEHDGRGFRFHSGERAESVVEGFAITRGASCEHEDGGAVLCEYNSSPTIANCVISGNVATVWYGEHGRGGGICCEYSSPTINSCTIMENSASCCGGGIYCGNHSNPTIANCMITNNAASSGGGGIYCYDYSRPAIGNCTISNNVTSSSGGGIYCGDRSSPMLSMCTISNNAAHRGGGVCCRGHSNSTISNCTISDNLAPLGGGVYCIHSSSPTITNTILWNDTPEEVYVDSGSPVVSYCDIQGGWTGTGNIDADPLFVDPDGPDGDPNTWEDNDYHLLPDSPCIDAGDNTAVLADALDLDGDGDTAEPAPFDLDGRLRFGDRVDTPDTGNPDPNYPDLPIVDMGAYEYLCLGDINDDGSVDTADLGILLAHYGMTGGATYADGDLNGDGVVDLADLAAMLSAYGTACP